MGSLDYTKAVSYTHLTPFNKDKASGNDKNKFTGKPKKIQSMNTVKQIENNNTYSHTISEAVNADPKNV